MYRRSRNTFLHVVLSLLVLAVATASAQTTASVTGRVTDPSGAVVPGATVTVKSLETGAIKTATTNDSGDYTVLGLPLGRQDVTAAKRGFRQSLPAHVNLVVGQEAVVNVQVLLPGEETGIVVVDQTPVVNTTTAQVAGVVGEQQIKDLPLNGRSFDNLITLNPGAVNYSSMKIAGTSTSNGNTFSVDGRRTYENIFLFNGIEYTGASQLAVTPGGVSNQLLGIDAIREFNVLTNDYSAEYGKRAGAQVSVVTQSGTNQLHGSLFEFLRNSALDARNFFDQGSVPPFRRNQFGAALGGPLKKDKWFLFGNYEGFRQVLNVSNVTVVPDDNARQGLLPNAAGVPTLVTKLNPAMLPYMQLWPEPNGPNLGSGVALSFNNPRQDIREDFGTVRSDYLISDRDTLSAIYTIDDGTSSNPQADPLFGSRELLRSQVASIEETHVISPEILNTFRAGFSRAAWGYTPLSFVSFPASLSFVSGLGPGGIIVGGGVSTTAGGTITSAGPNNASDVADKRNLFTYTDNVQIIKGRHQITAGLWFQRIQENENTASRQLGQASFASLTTFLQGTVTTFQVVPNPNELGWRSLFGAGYFEDSIKLFPNLTLQAGLRYEFTTGWNEVEGRAANYITGPNGFLQTDPIVGNSVYTKNNATHLLGPRAGLAWDVFGNGKTAIRAGYGMYYSLIDNMSFLLNSLPPYNSALSLKGSLPSLVPIVRNAPPAPGTVFAPQGIQPDAQTPTVQEWNLTFEQELSRNTVLRLGYVGSFGYHGFVAIDPNAIPPTVCASAAGCSAGGTLKAGSTVPQGTLYVPGPNAVLPNPKLSAAFFWYTEGNTSYNALQIDMTHRFASGFQFRANYTFSKNLDNNSALTIAQSSNEPQMIMNPYDLHRDWGPSAYNIPHSASFSGTYELPFGKNKPWANNLGAFGDHLVSGW
ncbi:MAG TPA: carboxypeptidase regulatory-like domain-containing protein [Bryobacteraceae bacterium]|nr:carboxypeptidase regulatory-like domain-containing protein [Bryobacteraceae bacterium]